MKDFDIDYSQFSNLSCYEEFEMKCTLAGISKIKVLKEIGQSIDNYYFFISKDGIFNWFDLKGNHIEDPGILKKLKDYDVPKNITKCIVPNSVTCLSYNVFFCCNFLKEVTIPDSITSIGDYAFSYCASLTSIIIPDNVKSIGYGEFYDCKSLKEVIFKGKTLEEVKQMNYYPFGIRDNNIIKCEK